MTTSCRLGEKLPKQPTVLMAIITARSVAHWTACSSVKGRESPASRASHSPGLLRDHASVQYKLARRTSTFELTSVTVTISRGRVVAIYERCERPLSRANPMSELRPAYRPTRPPPGSSSERLTCEDGKTAGQTG